MLLLRQQSREVLGSRLLPGRPPGSGLWALCLPQLPFHSCACAVLVPQAMHHHSDQQAHPALPTSSWCQPNMLERNFPHPLPHLSFPASHTCADLGHTINTTPLPASARSIWWFVAELEGLENSWAASNGEPPRPPPSLQSTRAMRSLLRMLSATHFWELASHAVYTAQAACTPVQVSEPAVHAAQATSPTAIW